MDAMDLPDLLPDIDPIFHPLHNRKVQLEIKNLDYKRGSALTRPAYKAIMSRDILFTSGRCPIQ